MIQQTSQRGIDIKLFGALFLLVGLLDVLIIEWFPAYALKRLLNHTDNSDVTSGYLVITTERLREPMEKISQYLLQMAGLSQVPVESQS